MRHLALVKDPDDDEREHERRKLAEAGIALCRAALPTPNTTKARRG